MMQTTKQNDQSFKTTWEIQLGDSGRFISLNDVHTDCKTI